MATRFFLISLFLFFSHPALALDQESFAMCISKLRQAGLEAGLPAQVISQHLDDVKLNEKVVELDRSQPEFTSSFADYFTRRVSEQRIEKGREKYRRHRPLLDTLTREYGIPGHYLVAFWGLETNYGGYLGNIPTLDALATLTCEGRRGDYFQGELFNALRILQAGDVDASQMKGSWAGAMGQTQFMPAVFLKHAQDHDGDGRRDLWGSTEDALASGAHFLQALGWEREARWGREVRLPKGFDYQLTGFGNKRPLADWAELGLTLPNGQPLPSAEMEAAVIVPAGHQGPAFLAYHNFRVIMGWNRSESYAIAVGRLADRIAGAGPLSQAPPQAPRLDREQVTRLQRIRNEQGFDAGEEEGLMGPGTRKAIARYQQANDLVADGFPGEEVLTRIGVYPGPSRE